LYFTDRGIEELDDRRGEEQVSIGWLAERLRDFVDDHPEAEATIERLASWLARLDEDIYEDADEDAAPAAGEHAQAGQDEDEDAASADNDLTDIQDE
jgi:Family of unknown function (DUF6104)